MSTGQTFLTLGALTLLSYTSININRAYISSVKDRVQVQRDIEIISYGQSLAELIYSYSPEDAFPTLDTLYGDCEDVENSCPQLERDTPLGFTLFAAISLNESAMADTLATITIYDRPEAGGEFVQRAEFYAAITRINTPN